MKCKPEVQLNCELLWDLSHGCCNDVDNAYGDLGLRPFCLMLLICHNLPHGIEKDEELRFFCRSKRC